MKNVLTFSDGSSGIMSVFPFRPEDYGFIVRLQKALVKYALFSDVVPIWELAEKIAKILLILSGAWCIMDTSLVQSAGRKE